MSSSASISASISMGRVAPFTLMLLLGCQSAGPTMTTGMGGTGGLGGAGGRGGKGGSGVSSGGSGAQAGSDGSGGSAGTGGSAGVGGSAGTGGAGGSAGTGGAGGDPMPGPDGPPGGEMGMPMPPPTAEEPLPPCLRTVQVAANDALAPALTGAMAGDCLVLADGTYSFPEITAKGTAANPIVVRAANTLKALVTTGNVVLQGAAYVVVQGLHFRSSGFIAMGDCDHCRVSRFRVERQETGAEQDWVIVRGTSKYCRVDHNDIGPQRSVGNMIMLSGVGPQVVQYTRIDHNYFHDVTYGGGNGWELIRAGLSGWTFSKAFTVIERNLFYRGDSDPETISVKSSDNIIRYNTMRATAGQFTLRHGNRTQVYGNYILGDGRGSTGMRVYGGGHKIYNNYMAGLAHRHPDRFGQQHRHHRRADRPQADLRHRRAVQHRRGRPHRHRQQQAAATPEHHRRVQHRHHRPDRRRPGAVDGQHRGGGQMTKVGDLFRLAPGSPALDAADAGPKGCSLS